MHPATYNVEEHLATCTLTINHAALSENWRKLDAASPGARTASVVKANGYGLGLGEVGLSLAASGCGVFFVATPDEGIRLRRTLKTREIFVFCGLTARNAAAYAESNLIPVLNTLDDIAIWGEFWKLRGSRRPCAIQLDTGMNRMGLGEDDLAKIAANESLRNSVNIITVLSHLACADQPENTLNRQQLTRFKEGSGNFAGSELSLANSAGIGLGSEYHFDLVRPGIALYGGDCSQESANMMNVVVTAEARILQIRQAKKGEIIGYGATHKFERDTKIAIGAVGYGDGYLRSSSQGNYSAKQPATPLAYGALAGHKAPVLGRVSMDCTAFDVTDIADQTLENTNFIELFGANIKLDDAARAAGSVGYELLTSIGQRYYRNHINQPEHATSLSE